jgi:hypothetical protein
VGIAIAAEGNDGNHDAGAERGRTSYRSATAARSRIIAA